MLVLLTIFFGLIFLYKAIMGYFLAQYMEQASQQVVTVSSMTAEYQSWQPTLKSSGSLRAILGVDVTTEVAGLVRSIYFKPGAEVSKGDLLLELNSDSEKAQLESLQAILALAEITYARDYKLYTELAVSKSTVDSDLANMRSDEAQVEQQKAVIAKKIIQAPFSGRLGISYVNPGQYLNPGDKIVTLQSLNPIYVDFYVPQQSLSMIEVGRSIELAIDTYPGKKFIGKITTINPIVDSKTRNVQVEATIENPDNLLYPGMFGNITVSVGKSVEYLTLPQTAITYNPYGDTVYIINKEKKKVKGQSALTVQQTFVEVGPTRDNQIAIISGIKPGDNVVTSGQMKLKNGAAVVINNQIAPVFENKNAPLKEE